MNPTIIVTFRGTAIEIPLDDSITVQHLRASVVQQVDPNRNGRVKSTTSSETIEAHNVKLMFKGRLLTDDSQNLKELLVPPGTGVKRTYRVMATGVSNTTVEEANQTHLQLSHRNKVLVRDDLSIEGQQKEIARRELGRRNLLAAKSRKMSGPSSSLSDQYGFGRIDVLDDLPNQSTARDILTTLANDPGIKACVVKNKWYVGSLAELYPEGKVGQSAVCVMGLNRNRGQQILLRIRTDDLKGFRKMTSIREVLYHELAHNVHSEHNIDFFQLMRQIKKECVDLDWTHGQGVDVGGPDGVDKVRGSTMAAHGGTYALGGNTSEMLQRSPRELMAQAALQRWSPEEEEVVQNCGCGHNIVSFLPPENKSDSTSHSSSGQRR